MSSLDSSRFFPALVGVDGILELHPISCAVGFSKIVGESSCTGDEELDSVAAAGRGDQYRQRKESQLWDHIILLEYLNLNL